MNLSILMPRLLQICATAPPNEDPEVLIAVWAAADVEYRIECLTVASRMRGGKRTVLLYGVLPVVVQRRATTPPAIEPEAGKSHDGAAGVLRAGIDCRTCEGGDCEACCNASVEKMIAEKLTQAERDELLEK